MVDLELLDRNPLVGFSVHPQRDRGECSRAECLLAFPVLHHVQLGEQGDGGRARGAVETFVAGHADAVARTLSMFQLTIKRRLRKQSTGGCCYCCCFEDNFEQYVRVC